MIFSLESAKEQISRLLMVYPELRIEDSSDHFICLEGTILVHRTVDDYTLRKQYGLRIVVPIGNDDLPYVIDTSNTINKSYAHIYSNGMLCLETDVSIRRRFVDGFDLIAWMDEFVEPYFVTYEYYSEYGRFPYGERNHGSEGVLQSYQDIFGTTNYIETFDLLCFIRDHKYRGHLQCPCGSGKRVRNCHGPMMRMFYDHDILMRQVFIDMDRLDAEMRAYYARRNTKPSK